MLSIVQQYIEEKKLLNKSKLQLVALSGGADSVALLIIMHELGYRIEAAHCNFHLRGEESKRDEEFVHRLCKQRNIPLHLAHFDTHAYAELHKVSIEMAARNLRYRYFEQLRQDIDAECICVAHHRNDSVETLLINLVRGTGIHGLTGIRPKNGAIVRPLLCVSKEQIVNYLNTNHQPYVTDSTNLVDDVVRNKIRLNILPLLQQLNPSVIDCIAETTKWMNEVEQLYNNEIRKIKESFIHDNKLCINELLHCTIPGSFLFEWLSTYGFSSATIQQIYTNLHVQTGKNWSSATHRVAIDRGYLCVAPKTKKPAPLHIPEPGNYVMVFNAKKIFRITISHEIQVSRVPECATLDASLVHFPLTIRTIEPGDWFIPFGMKGRKLANDYLTDRKCPVLEREQQLVVTDGNGQIVWLVGQRTDQRFAVNQRTEQILRIEFIIQ